MGRGGWVIGRSIHGFIIHSIQPRPTPSMIHAHDGTYVVHLVEADEGLEEADVGPRQPVPQQVALPAQHGLCVV